MSISPLRALWLVHVNRLHLRRIRELRAHQKIDGSGIRLAEIDKLREKIRHNEALLEGRCLPAPTNG